MYDKRGRLLWRTRVERAPVAVEIPAFSGRVGRVEIRWPNGEVSETKP
jgi:hypothetical protein